MTDQDKQKKIEAALQESAKVEQTLIMAAPILMDIRGVGSFSLPIPGTDPVKYVAAGTLAEIERATRRQDALQQISDFGQEQDAAPAAQPAPVAAGVDQNDEILRLHRELAAEKLRADQGWRRAEAKAKECAELRDRLASLAPVAAEPVRQVLLSQRESFERWFSDEGKWPRAVDRSGEGYRLAHAQSAWQAWKACYAALDITGRPSGAPVHDAPQVLAAAEARIFDLEQQLAECVALTNKWAAAAGEADGRAVKARAAALEEAAQVAEAQNRVGYEWVKDSLWDNIIKRVPAAIRALPAAPSVEVKGEQGEMGGDDLRAIADFLMGESELEGVKFGEKHPTKAGAYWWRLNLRAALHKARGG